MHQYTGFLDAATLLASCGTDTDTATHWLLDAPAARDQPVERTLGGPGTRPVSYPPAGPPDPPPHMWALRDGTWLTTDPGTLYRWTR